ncbi:FeoC-like transcriptional regulator [Endozoicomonas sp. Mp262]|uniref:FeoC-like transcriptional regulator n=1 Tax=Endozoicomonas sp. Mp262 TaxID=2919499 RepID=UPI0021D9B19D
MLIAIRDYISHRGACSLAEISMHFKTSPDAMRGMLSHWVRKGIITTENSGCGKGCVSCSPEQLELYRWCQNKNQFIPVCNLS